VIILAGVCNICAAVNPSDAAAAQRFDRVENKIALGMAVRGTSGMFPSASELQ